MRLLLLAVCTVATLAIGCAQNSPQLAQKAKPPAEHHHAAGPHGGTVTDWGGGKYHVEFTVDHDKKEATIYILGSDEKTPAPVKASKLLLSINEPSFQVDLIPHPLAGEVEGSSSRFVGQHENFDKVQGFAGTISGEVDGTPYAGDFTEEPDGHSHKL